MFIRSVLSFFVLGRLATLASSTCANTPAVASNSQDLTDFLSRQYDYIIVGGGTAGVALGVRLAANPELQIAILEAGDFHSNDPIVDIPENGGQAIGNPLYDWNFVSVAQPNAGGRQMSMPRGKMLGGSSGINGLAWNRASSVEYDAWQAFGGTSWSWNNLLPYFKKSESVATPDVNPYPGISPTAAQAATNNMPNVHGFSGPISASHNTFYFEVVNAFVSALNALGISTNAQPGGGDATGVYNTYATVDRTQGVRSYSASAYYCQSSTSNLHVLVGARATRILFQNAPSGGLTATGVTFSANSQTYTADATAEVILTTGTVQTPQLLELSGIGNAGLLEGLGITSLIDLPQVGENLQEHLFVGVQWKLNPGYTTFDILRNNATYAAEQMTEYTTSKTGLYTELDSTVAFVPSSIVTNSQGVSDLLAAFDLDAQNPNLSPLQQLQLQTQRSWFVGQEVGEYEIINWSRALISPAANENYIVALGGVSHPTSRGSIHISSSNPLQAPTIDPKFLSTEFDRKSHLALLKFVQSIGTQSPLAPMINVQTNPDPTAQSDNDLQSWIQSTSGAGDHLIGTAIMAPQSLGGVVSSELKVYGTTNLRVVDASIFPMHMAAHIQSTVYAIAEMAADMILNP